MRVSVQGHLILLLGLFSGFVHAGYSTNSSGPFTYGTPEAAHMAWVHAGNMTSTEMDSCTPKTGSHPNFWGQCSSIDPIRSWVGHTSNIYFKEPECQAWMHEGDDGQEGGSECGFCRDGWKDHGADEMPRCKIIRDSEECFEKGELFDDTYKMCVPECEGMVLDGFCLDPYDTEDDDEGKCTPETDGFVGTYGEGNKKTHVCAPFQQECKDNKGTFGIVNGEATCLPEGYGAPECKSGSANDVLVNDGYGFVCETVGNPEEEEDTPPDPNTDTDGDGVPDEYDRSNDPDAGNKQRDEMLDGQKKGNEKLDGANDRLDKLAEIGKEGNSFLDDIEDGIGGINAKLDGLGEAPEGGFSLSVLTDAIPTFSDTATGFGDAIAGTQMAQFAQGLTNIPSSASCPVYVMPQTEYWDSMPMTIHCDIFEEYRGLFSVIFMFFWTGTALFVFLRA